MNRPTEKISNDLIGAAGVHFVAFKLSLRGLIALPTIRNTAGIDLLVSNPRTLHQAVLQVKTSLKAVKFWPTNRPLSALKGPNSFYVFLRYQGNIDSFEAFLATGDDVAQQIKENAEDYVKRERKEFSYWSLRGNEERLREAWENWVC
jgi:hypothetical protein